MQREAKPHDVCVILPEPQGRGVLRKVFKGHPEEVDIEFAVEIVEFVIAFAVWGIRIRLCQVAFVVGTVPVDTLPNHKEFPAFNGYKGVAAERTSEFKRFVEAVILRGKERTADLAHKLAFGAVVTVEVIGGSVAAGTAGISRDAAFTASADGFQFTAVMRALVLAPEMLPVLLFKRDDPWQFICFELLILGGMGIIEGPLLQGNISANKTDQPTILLIKRIDN